MSRARKTDQLAPVEESGTTAKDNQSFTRVLLIDNDQETVDQVVRTLGHHPNSLLQADDPHEADQLLHHHRVDVVLLSPGKGDDAAQWLDRLASAPGRPRVILLSDGSDMDHIVSYIRAGASDVLAKPLDPAQLKLRVDAATELTRKRAHAQRRFRRLRKMCRNLAESRKKVSRQVDTLCGDLVNAYQELAEQVQHVVQTTEYAAVIGGELDLERVLRKTLEFLLEKAGPTNAAVFLPSTLDEFSLGGYVNYDWSTGSPELLLQNLADGIAPRVATSARPMHLQGRKAIIDLLGDDGEFLANSNLLAACCRHEKEPLAVIILFRNHDEPFEEDLVETITGIAPMLGDYLARIIRIHHRSTPNPPYSKEA
ncbi:MAG: response regulator [Phycisphaeraceae bacterium]|nr:response regulator [Phycisphaeraceae bacterium]